MTNNFEEGDEVFIVAYVHTRGSADGEPRYSVDIFGEEVGIEPEDERYLFTSIKELLEQQKQDLAERLANCENNANQIRQRLLELENNNN